MSACAAALASLALVTEGRGAETQADLRHRIVSTPVPACPWKGKKRIASRTDG